MPEIPAYAAIAAGQPLAPYAVEAPRARPRDVELDILFCGVCHSDIHQARDEWGGAIFPMVPGHEIVGRVAAVGKEVSRFAVGDLAGVGCMVDSCRDCDPCRQDTEQFCEKGAALTYNGTEMDRRTPTYGGYSTRVVVDERFVLKVPAGLDPAGAAPLLCAGITTYSPLRQWRCKAGDQRRRGRPRRPRPHGGQARRLDGRRGHGAQHLAAPRSPTRDGWARTPSR